MTAPGSSIVPPAAPSTLALGSATTTAAATLGTAGAGTVLIWIIRCFEEGGIQAPSAEVAMTICAFLAPIWHATLNAISRKIEKWGQ